MGWGRFFLAGKRGGPIQVSLKLNLASDRGQHHPPRLSYRHTFCTLHHRMSKIKLGKALPLYLLHLYHFRVQFPFVLHLL